MLACKFLFIGPTLLSWFSSKKGEVQEIESNMNKLAEIFRNKFQALVLCFRLQFLKLCSTYNKIRKKENLLHNMIFFPLLNEE